jgi:Cell wall-associated hydrolases (invasion-associated proteins)
MNKSKYYIVFLLFVFSATAYAESKQIQLANRVIQSVSRKYAPDKRTAVFSVQTSELAGKIILKGKTDHPEAQKLLLDSLAILRINVQDSVLILPDKQLGDKTWGLVKLSVANLRTKPAHAEEMATQALMGTPVKILEEKGEWWLVQTPDLYIAWANHGAIIPKTAEEMTNWKKSKRYIYNQLNGFAYSAPDKKAMPVTDLVICDLFEVIGEVKGYLRALLPDGRTAFVKKNECLSFQEWTGKPLQIPSVMQVAKKMMGVPYFWGGTSSKATDCSGLTKTSYYSQGVVLARDASQQMRYGMHPDFSDYRNLQPGDLIFFGSSAQRVTHVALYLGNGLFIHASGSSAMVRLNSLNPNDLLFDASLLKIMVGSSRVSNSLNTDGITLVKDHPWYSTGK